MKAAVEAGFNFHQVHRGQPVLTMAETGGNHEEIAFHIATHPTGNYSPARWYGGNHDKVGWQLIGYDGSLNHKAPFGYYDAEYLKMSANPGGKV